jgi:hypothetical protein
MEPVPDLEDLNVYNVLANLGRSRRNADDLDQQIVEIVAAARGFGWSWEKIGEALGTSRQAAWERYASAVGTDRAGSASD